MSSAHLLILAALLLPLSLDAFVLSAALGLAGMPKRDQVRTSLVLSLFEAVMPVIGAFIGNGLGSLIGHYGPYIAAAVIGIAGLVMLRPSQEDEEERRVNLLSRAKGWSIIALGLSISIDGLAIGLSLGLLHVPLAFVVIYIAVQSLIVTRLGLWLGGRLSERFRTGAERLGGALLVAVAVLFILLSVSGHQL